MRKFEEIVKELVEIEMSDNSHCDFETDYDSKLDFYLSNVDQESYTGYYLQDDDVLSAEEREAYSVTKIRDAVRDYIISNCPK